MESGIFQFFTELLKIVNLKKNPSSTKSRNVITFFFQFFWLIPWLISSIRVRWILCHGGSGVMVERSDRLACERSRVRSPSLLPMLEFLYIIPSLGQFGNCPENLAQADQCPVRPTGLEIFWRQSPVGIHATPSIGITSGVPPSWCIIDR